MTRMPQSSSPRDRFDDIPSDPQRVGAHRAARPRFRWVVTLMWWLLAVAVLSVGGILAVIALQQNDRLDIDLPSPDPTASATPETAPAVIDTGYPVLLFNGAGEEVAVDPLQAALVAEGWAPEQILVADDDQDIAVSTVYYVAEGDEGAARGVAELLGIEAVELNPDFATMSEGGITVLLGLDRVSAE